MKFFFLIGTSNLVTAYTLLIVALIRAHNNEYLNSKWANNVSWMP